MTRENVLGKYGGRTWRRRPTVMLIESILINGLLKIIHHYPDFNPFVAILNILLNPYLKLSTDDVDMIFQAQGFDKQKILCSFSAKRKQGVAVQIHSLMSLLSPKELVHASGYAFYFLMSIYSD